MTPIDLVRLRQWFSGYVDSFRTASEADQRNYDLKESHTYRVLSNSRLIARGAGLDEAACLRGEAAALLHDVGRFRQYRDFRTFRDRDSVNHAELGVTVIRESAVLADLPATDRELIELAVGLHNAFTVPDGLDRAAGDAVALLRDADKLDIWRLFSELFALDPAERASAATLGLAELPVVTTRVVEMLASGRMVDLALVKTVNDYKLLLLSWVYDLGYGATARLVAQRRLVDRVAATLPADLRLELVVATVHREVARRSSEEIPCSKSASSA